MPRPEHPQPLVFEPKPVPVPPQEKTEADNYAEFVRQEIIRDRVHFWNTLVSFADRFDFQPQDPERINILDSACGRCPESLAVNSFFGGKQLGELSEKVYLYGIDQNDEWIYMAREMLPRDGSWDDHFTFIQGDARNLPSHDEIPHRVDLALIRHQQFISARHNSEFQSDWEDIIMSALMKLEEGRGQALVTSRSKNELQLLEEYLSRIRCEFSSHENPNQEMPFGSPDGSRDRWLTFVK